PCRRATACRTRTVGGHPRAVWTWLECEDGAERVRPELRLRHPAHERVYLATEAGDDQCDDGTRAPSRTVIDVLQANPAASVDEPNVVRGSVSWSDAGRTLEAYRRAAHLRRRVLTNCVNGAP